MDENEILLALEFLNKIKESVDRDNILNVNPYKWIDSIAKEMNIKAEWHSLMVISEFFRYYDGNNCKLIPLYKTGIKFNKGHIDYLIPTILNFREQKENTKKRKIEFEENQKRLEEIERNKILDDVTEKQRTLAATKKYIRRTFPLSFYTDKELIEELRKRNYTGEIYIKTKFKL